MRHLVLRLRRSRRDDTGAALITVLLMMTVVSALLLTISVIATNNLASARLAQQAGAAINASDAGVSQAVTYLRQNGVRAINKCWIADGTQASGCPAGWGNQSNPAVVTINGKAAQSYKVWIKPIARFPDNKLGRYEVHSTGVAGGPAGRNVVVEADIEPIDFTLGVVAASVSGGGNAGMHHESIFSTGCVYQRSKIDFTGVDAAFKIPAAVHTSQIITDSNGSGPTCPTTSKPIHDPSKTGEAKNCNVDNSGKYRYDEDKYGGTLATTGSCFDYAHIQYPGETQFTTPPPPDNLAYQYPTTSYADESTLKSKYGVKRPVFTQAQLDGLKSVAQSQGNYYTTNTYAMPDETDAVMYFDLSGASAGATVDLNNLATIPPTGALPWQRVGDLDETHPSCLAGSLLIVITGGDARLNSNSKLVASLFMTSSDPYGNVYKANGTSMFTGNIYANNLDLTGTTDLYMDKCFIANVSPALSTVRLRDYREVDR